MAFEIYNGVASGATVAGCNEIIDKIIEMWECDSSDTTSEGHSATYGNCTIAANASNAGRFIVTMNGETLTTSFQLTSNNLSYKIVKAGGALILNINTSSASGANVFIFGTITNIDGSTSKGAIEVTAATNATFYACTDDENSMGVSDTMRTTDGLVQLAPYISTFKGWYFDNVLRVLAANNGTLVGEYNINGENYFIVYRTAIKDE